MARPVPRRRSGSSDEAPDADQYTSGRGRGRSSREEEPEEDRRPRRGRGELPARGRSSEPEPERTTEGTEIPESSADLEKVSDEDYNDLLGFFDIPEGLKEAEEFDALWEAIEKSREPEEPPSRGRRGRSSRDEEPEEAPRGRGRGRGRAEEPEDEPPARGRGRGRSRDEEEDKPRRGGGRGGGRGRDDDEPNDRPSRTPRAGFQGYKKAREQTFDGDFKLTEDELLAKFLDDEPFDTYVEHGLYNELRDGQRVWICIEDGCPICATGHKGRAISLWNIVAIPEEGDPTVEVLKAGPGLTKELEKKAGLKTGPVSKEYYSLSQPITKRGEQPQGPNVEVVRERDVKEDWNFDPFTDDELDAFREQTPDPKTYVQFPSLRQLKDVAKLLRDSD